MFLCRFFRVSKPWYYFRDFVAAIAGFD